MAGGRVFVAPSDDANLCMPPNMRCRVSFQTYNDEPNRPRIWRRHQILNAAQCNDQLNEQLLENHNICTLERGEEMQCSASVHFKLFWPANAGSSRMKTTLSSAGERLRRT